MTLLADMWSPHRLASWDLDSAREKWIKEAVMPGERAEREQSSMLAYRDHAGLVADFHSLRHTFISNLARAGVHPKLAQSLARHSRWPRRPQV